MIVDTHCHLTLTKHLSINDHLIRAKSAGIKVILDPGLCVADFKSRYSILKTYLNHDKLNLLNSNINEKSQDLPQVLLGLAVAPHYLNQSDRSDVDDTQYKTLEPLAIDSLRNQMVDIIEHYPVTALSEIGLDYFHMVYSKSEQQELFLMQLQLAKEYDLPVFLHIRDAYQDAYELVKESGHTRGAVHCFTGNQEDAKHFLFCDFYLSFSGIITFKKSSELRTIINIIPVNRIISETDAPYLSPVPFRGKLNESAYITYTNQCIAEQIGKSQAECNKQLWENTSQLLGI